MASLPGNIILSTAIIPNKKSRFCTSLQVRAQSYGDEAGRSRNIVDANLYLLKVRIEEVKNKERLEKCRHAEPGWNYASVEISYKAKREKEFLHNFLQLVGIGGGALGLTILSCTFCLYITSLILHLNQ